MKNVPKKTDVDILITHIGLGMWAQPCYTFIYWME